MNHRKIKGVGWLVLIGVGLALFVSAAPSKAYPYWPEYKKVPLSDIRPQEWRAADDVTDGWDWSLPPDVKPAENGLLAIQRTSNLNRSLDKLIQPLNLPVNPTIALWIKWKQIEPVEGQYEFATLRQRIEEADALGYSVVLRLLCSATTFAPDWMAQKGVPIRTEYKADSKMVNYEVSHPEFHSRYMRLIEALGQSGIPQMEPLKGAFVGYASPSNGDEGIGPHGVDADTVPHVIERLDAWARAFKGVENKVFMGGVSQYGLEQGFGIRRGFVEMYLYHIPDEGIGQTLDENGYLWMDESAELLRTNPFHGEENEEYEEAWATPARDCRFGTTTESFSYRYFTSNLRLLQMRCNYVLYNQFSLMPEQLVWVGQSLGRTVEDSPDIWCALRESQIRKHGAVKNFERWLYQRDSEGFETKPAMRIEHPVKMWMVEEGMTYDYVARSGKRIGLAVDDRWCGGKPTDVAIKVSYFDIGKGEVELGVRTKRGSVTRTFKRTDTGKLKTATFFIDQAVFSAQGMEHDIIFQSKGSNAVLSFVRIVRL
ncbi:beta-galactosidase [Pontiella sulfatireligans]|uniref:Glycoside hydrolase family 42 N-terminal domain-containing protein n=1 Tax=Pontiella sulfatireligans TaxID=2750658 RepID=A0A6C2UKN4_9BACT|nr:beta-galactosidase [Pontiella sulfatireligans]VGO20668.1 hypothetical protein SCARR_02734 [Pontiella sulfatireligans]